MAAEVLWKFGTISGMNKMSLLMVAGVMLVGCSGMKEPGCCVCFDALRVAALQSSAWNSAEWISVKGAPIAGEGEKKLQRAADGTSVFWRDIANKKTVKSAKWMTSGLGVYDLYLNGFRVGDDALKPGFTHVQKTRRSFTYDLTPLIKFDAGAVNRFAAEVSAGWWRDQIVLYAGQKSAFRGVIEFTYADGTTELVGTKANEWNGAVAGPVTHAAIFDGEEYDARLTNAARSEGDFASAGCERNDEFKGEILPSAGAEIVLREDLAIARGPYVVKSGETLVVDFGQNCAAVPRFVFQAKAGTVLTALPAEMLNDADRGQRGCDGPKDSVYRANYRIPDSGMRIVYTFGDSPSVYTPAYTFFGYRYIAITATDTVKIKRIVSIPVTSITKKMELGKIETGDKDLNRFIANVYWGQLSNYLSVPTDCPQRNERLGWTADTQVFAEAGAFSADTSAFFHKWMRDMRDSQHEKGGFPGVAPWAQYGNDPMRLGWADAGVIVPYQVWKQFGDTKIVAENWAAMEKYVARVAETKYEYEATKGENGGFQWADWLSYEDYESCSGKAWKDSKKAWRGSEYRPETKVYWNYLGACYWLWDAQMMETMAKVVGKDAAKYAKMADEARAYLKATFFDPKDGLILSPFRGMQTPALFALKFGLVEGEAKAATIAALKQNFKDHGDCLQTGFLGTSIIMDTLVENGMADIAYTLLLQHKNPSWLYSVDQGATTVWERWNSYTKKDGFGPVGMNSFNHYAYGAVLAWIYRRAAGIAADPANPGFRNIIMAPVPSKRLGFVKAEYRSRAGLIKSAWKYEGDKWIWDFTVPEGATAIVTLPGETAGKPYDAGTYHIER